MQLFFLLKKSSELNFIWTNGTAGITGFVTNMHLRQAVHFSLRSKVKVCFVWILFIISDLIFFNTWSVGHNHGSTSFDSVLIQKTRLVCHFYFGGMFCFGLGLGKISHQKKSIEREKIIFLEEFGNIRKSKQRKQMKNTGISLLFRCRHFRFRNWMKIIK